MLGVYIHIPFCESKCLYCAFSSFVKNDDFKRKYIDKLIEEINAYTDGQKIDTIYIGGGTPSLLDAVDMTRLIVAIKNKFIIQDDYEFTIECNPCSLTEEKLECYQKLGVNRISLGVQSLDDDQLAFVGRRHNAITAESAIKLAKRYIPNVSCDLLIGLKGMEKEDFCNQLDRLCEWGVQHISAYMLQIEKGTPLEKMVVSTPCLLPDDDECVDVYDEMVKRLHKMGYFRYEVSNFAKLGKESRHNFKYWTGEDYVGFGLGAHSYVNGKRWANSSKFDEYFKGILASEEVLSDNQKLEEHIMLGLRCKAGISKSFLLDKGYDIQTNENFIEFCQKGILVEKEDSVYLNPNYYGVSNYIIVKLLP